MQYVNETLLSAPDTSTQTSVQFDLYQVVTLSFHTFFGDATANGSIKVQVSNDLKIPNQANGTFLVANWIDLPGISATITSGAPALLTIPTVAYRWCRFIYTSVSGGSSTITVNLFAVRF